MIFAKDLPIDAKYPLSCVYWIYLDGEHTDPRTSGYVGVSIKGIKHRFEKHLRSVEYGSKLHVHNAIRLHRDKIKVKVLALADPEACLLIEYLLRPLPEMQGTWNIMVGGAQGNLGRKLTEETRANMRKAQTPERRKRQSEQRKLIPAWLHNSAYKSLWASADLAYICFENHENCSADILAKAFRLKPSQTISIVDKFNSGWVPLKDSKWVEWAASEECKLVCYWNIGDTNISYDNSKPDWTNHNALMDVWVAAEFIYKMFQDKIRPTQVLRNLGLESRRGSIAKIQKKIKSGWNPSEDASYLAWLSEYKQKQELANGT